MVRLPQLFGFALVAAVLGGAATARAAPDAAAIQQTPQEALAHDAAEYARGYGLALDEAIRRLRFQEASVVQTDALRVEFKDRLAGLWIEHFPDYRVSILLTGAEPVAGRSIAAGGTVVPVMFATGATATYDQLVEALRIHQEEMRVVVPRSQGMGVDPRTGAILVLVKASDGDEASIARYQQDLAAIAGVPVHAQLADREDVNLAVEGGSRVAGVDPKDGRHYACTTGFVVTDASRTGIVTAAHCPDELTYFAPDGAEVPLAFVGEWGARIRDVQVHVTDSPQTAEFYVDKARTLVRPLITWRNRQSTRAGDIVCHRGESSGYSCSLVELVDFAPPGTLCGGPCDPAWVTVAGPSCRGGDSGGPIFAATTAFGIVKGASYRRSGACNFYYYMSTDYLPEGWTLLVTR